MGMSRLSIGIDRVFTGKEEAISMSDHNVVHEDQSKRRFEPERWLGMM